MKKTIAFIIVIPIIFCAIWTFLMWDNITAEYNGSKRFTEQQMQAEYERGHQDGLMDNTTLQNIISNHLATISSLNAQIVLLTSQVQTLTAQNETLTGGNISNLALIAVLNNQITVLQTTIAELQGTISYYETLLAPYMEWQTVYSGNLSLPHGSGEERIDATDLTQKASLSVAGKMTKIYLNHYISMSSFLEYVLTFNGNGHLVSYEGSLASDFPYADYDYRVHNYSTQNNDVVRQKGQSVIWLEGNILYSVNRGAPWGEIVTKIECFVEKNCSPDTSYNDGYNVGYAAALLEAQAQLNSLQTQVDNLTQSTLDKSADISALNEQITNLQSYISYLQDLIENGSTVIGPVSFAVDSWQTIAANPDFYNVGDEKDIELTTGEIITITILGKNHDDLSGSTNKASLSIGMKNLLATTYEMSMYKGNSNTGGWDVVDMREYTLQTIFSQLPAELQEVIKLVNKPTANNGSRSPVEIINSQDKLWLFSEKELYGTNPSSHAGEGEQYAYFNQNNWQNSPTSSNTIRIKYLANGAGAAAEWLLRSANKDSTTDFCSVSVTGNVDSARATYEMGVCFGFCI